MILYRLACGKTAAQLLHHGSRGLQMLAPFLLQAIHTSQLAIGNHDEGTGVPVSAMAAALIIADKSDVRRSRVRNKEDIHSDIHDRVNYAVTNAKLEVFPEADQILLSLSIDTEIGSLMEYFEIFTKRMLLCRKAAERLGCAFRLKINGQLVA